MPHLKQLLYLLKLLPLMACRSLLHFSILDIFRALRHLQRRLCTLHFLDSR
jgi:hypothetical protein